MPKCFLICFVEEIREAEKYISSIGDKPMLEGVLRIIHHSHSTLLNNYAYVCDLPIKYEVYVVYFCLINLL